MDIDVSGMLFYSVCQAKADSFDEDIQRPCRSWTGLHLLPESTSSNARHGHTPNHQTSRLRWRPAVYHWCDTSVSTFQYLFPMQKRVAECSKRLVALQSGGYSHPWSSAYVLCTLLIGVALIAAFFVWEWKGAKYPMVPKELFAGQRVVALAYGVAFIGGMSFYSLLNMYPLTYSTVYDPDPVKVGVRAVGVAICNIAGAVFFNSMLSLTKGRAREILLLASIIMSESSHSTLNTV